MQTIQKAPNLLREYYNIIKLKGTKSYIAAHKALSCKWVPSHSRCLISPLRVWVCERVDPTPLPALYLHRHVKR
jgi:hypothetical protein